MHMQVPFYASCGDYWWASALQVLNLVGNDYLTGEFPGTKNCRCCAVGRARRRRALPVIRFRLNLLDIALPFPHSLSRGCFIVIALLLAHTHAQVSGTLGTSAASECVFRHVTSSSYDSNSLPRGI